MATASADERSDRFCTMFREFAPTVRGYVRTMVASHDVEPVVQATFETAWAKLEDIPLASQRAWLFAVARNQVSNHRRSERRRGLLVDAVLALRPVDELFGPEADTVQLSSLLAALQRMPSDEREVIQLLAWQGMGTAEIAVVLGLSPNATRVRIHRVRKHLKGLLQAEVEEAAS